MRLLQRLKNAYSYGGIREIIRKTVYYCIYRINNMRTRNNIIKTSVEEYGLVSDNREKNIIVSLTSFPARFSQIELCLKSLVLQSFKPNKIIVYLGSDSSAEMLTKEMLDYEKYGVEYRFDDHKNLMPHKKYFYAMQDYPEAIIVTADDDIIYPRDWLLSLYQSYERYPNAVSARRVHLITLEGNVLAPYNHWEDQCRKVKTPSHRLIATGNSGVLYPPHCFDKEAFNVTAIQETCLKADDLWLKCMEIRNNIPVVWVHSWEVSLPEIDNKGNKKLSDENVFERTNDEVLSNIMEHYKIRASDFFCD